MRVVDRIADDIQTELFKLAPALPSEWEYQLICHRVTTRHGREIKRIGQDGDGQKVVYLR